MHPILHDFGFWTLYWYGPLLAAAYLIALQFAAVRARQRGIDSTKVMDLGIYLIIAALVGINYYARYIRAEERLARVGLSLILGGALGNLIDRLRQSYVVDFVDVYWRGWHFWAFNVADAAITIGVGLMILDILGVGRQRVPRAV